MLKITVISVGLLKEAYYKQAIDEYEKRSSAFCRINNVNLKEAPFDESKGSSAAKAALEDEADRILAHIPKGAFKIALCIEGKQLSSEELAGTLSDVTDRCGECVFIIGSSHGLSERVKRAADMRLSFSKLTFPHRLARVMLSETIYRSMSIISGRKYHK